MNMYYLIVDGMLSGTGIRNPVDGGYINPEDLCLSAELVKDISVWLTRYADAHYIQFEDLEENAALDREGIAICKRINSELPQSKIEYFSNAEMQKIPF